MTMLSRTAAAILCSLAVLPFASAEPARNEGVGYHWSSAPIGGGGYVTGVIVHPREPGLIYVRTDVGGAYRWSPQPDSVGRHWIPMTDFAGWEEREFQSIDGFAVDPADPDILYLCAGNGPDLPSDVLRSSDRGATWQRTHLDRLFLGNGRLRWSGERIAVNPHRPGEVWVGTRRDGLWVNPDGAPGGWQRAAGWPEPEAHVLLVAFDAERAGRVYATVAEQRVYRSDDGGQTWHLIAGEAVGGPADVSRGVVFEGAFYVTAAEGVFRYLQEGAGGAWTDLTPRTGAKDWCGLAVTRFRPGGPVQLVVAESFSGFDTPLWVSGDGGSPGTWREISRRNGGSLPQADVPWHRPEMFAAATSALAFDPSSPGRVWLTDWYAIWWTDDIHAQPVRWTTRQMGHEEVVNLALEVPAAPGSATILYSGHADIGGFAHVSLTAFPKRSVRNVPGAAADLLVEVTGIDASEGSPGRAALVGASNWDDGSGGHGVQRGALFLTEDGGATLRRAPGYPEEWKWGRVAYDAADARNVVVVARGAGVQATFDGGETFVAGEGTPAAAALGIRSHIFNRIHPLAADKVVAGTFYLYAMEENRMYVSEDGGRRWTPRGALPRRGDEPVVPNVALGRQAVFVETAPGHAHHLWVSLGGRGLFASTDGGSSWRAVPGLVDVPAFAIGRARDEHAYPALYCFGRKESGSMELWRSDDAGDSWVRLTDDRHRFGKTLRLAADRTVYGRIFLGTSGRGVIVGELP